MLKPKGTVAQVQTKNGKLVLRDSDGRVVHADKVNTVRQVEVIAKRKTWRAAIRRTIGNDGEELWTTLLNIARGTVVVPSFKNELGETMTAPPMVPSFEVRRAAARDLLEFAFGKPVAQTEVVKAEQEANQMAQYEAMTDEELAEQLKKFATLQAEVEAVPALSEGEEDE